MTYKKPYAKILLKNNKLKKLIGGFSRSKKGLDLPEKIKQKIKKPQTKEDSEI